MGGSPAWGWGDTAGLVGASMVALVKIRGNGTKGSQQVLENGTNHEKQMLGLALAIIHSETKSELLHGFIN